jgi:DNA-binding NarL/FixJ family response regulator
VSSPVRVLLVDDQRLVRSGFAMILSAEDDVEVVGEAANGREAVALAVEHRPDVILMDVQMPVLDGIAATREIVAANAGKVIILTTFDRDDYLFAALAAGASGFLLKNADPEHLVDAIRAVADGHALLSPEVTRRVIEQMTAGRTPSGSDPVVPPVTGDRSPAEQLGRSVTGTDARERDKRLARLTDREREVLELIAQGLSNSEIASTLFLGEATVKTHVSNCLAKLHLRDRVQAVVFAYEAGVIHPAD